MRPQPGDDYTVPVTVQIPRPLYGRIRRAAERHGSDVGPLVTAILLHALERPAPAPRRDGPDQALLDTIRRLHSEGVSDNRIAPIVGRSQVTVSRLRRRMGLPALRSFGGSRRVPDAG